MNYPPIKELAQASSAVTTLLGSAPMRLYPAGIATQNVIKPYGTYTLVYGSPENYIGGRPDIDQIGFQLDIYAATLVSLRAVVRALRDAYEPSAYIVRWGNEDQDPDTKNDHQSFDVEFLTPR
jgi:uncharacterized protein DUF3168